MDPAEVHDMDWELEDEVFSVGRFFLGVMVGAAIGSAVALLLAPQSGEETRSSVTDAGMAVKDRLVDTYATVADRASETAHSVRDRTSQATGSVKSHLDEWVARTKETIEETRQRLDTAMLAGVEAYEDKKRELDAQVDESLDA